MHVSDRNPSSTAAGDPGALALVDRLGLRLPYSGHPYRVLVAVSVVIALGVNTLVHERSTFSMVNQWLIYSIIAIGFYFVYAVAGQFAFCQAFMAGLGAYSAGWASQHVGFLLSVLFALVVVAIVALGFAVLLRKANDLYFAIATLGFAEIGLLVCRKWESFGGIDGDRIGVPKPSLFGLKLSQQSDVFWLILAVLVFVLVLGTFVERSPLRRELLAAKQSRVVASTLGIPSLHLRLGVFVFGSVLGALGGALYAHSQGSVSVDSFGLDLGIGLFLMVLLGGSASIWGGVIGAAFYVLLPDWLEGLSEYREVLYGVILLVVMVTVPEGLIGLAHGAVDLVRRKEPPPPEHHVPEAPMEVAAETEIEPDVPRSLRPGATDA
jgi:branched-chain amino acid transport system permease protein